MSLGHYRSASTQTAVSAGQKGSVTSGLGCQCVGVVGLYASGGDLRCGVSCYRSLSKFGCTVEPLSIVNTLGPSKVSSV